MRKMFIALLAFGGLFSILATEPAPSSMTAESGLIVAAIYAGDYGQPQGRAYVQCTNGSVYYFNLDLASSKLMYTNALTAYTTGKRISVYRRITSGNGVATEFEAFRIAIMN
jgi:hypothetical protein